MNNGSQWENGRGSSDSNKYSERKHYGQHYNNGGNTNYSPSTSYNYKNGKRPQGKNVPRRRIDRFKRDGYNSNDRIIKQNDIMIKLLKEIRDRLPALETPEKQDNGVAQNNEQKKEAVTKESTAAAPEKPLIASMDAQESSTEENLTPIQADESTGDQETVTSAVGPDLNETSQEPLEEEPKKEG